MSVERQYDTCACGHFIYIYIYSKTKEILLVFRVTHRVFYESYMFAISFHCYTCTITLLPFLFLLLFLLLLLVLLLLRHRSRHEEPLSKSYATRSVRLLIIFQRVAVPEFLNGGWMKPVSLYFFISFCIILLSVCVSRGRFLADLDVIRLQSCVTFLSILSFLFFHYFSFSLFMFQHFLSYFLCPFLLFLVFALWRMLVKVETSIVTFSRNVFWDAS